MARRLITMAKVKAEEPSEPFVQELNWEFTGLGMAMYIKIMTRDYRRLSWTEVWEAFSAAYPDSWAIQIFPPASQLIDDENIYHLFVIDHEPQGMNIHPDNDS